jgi:hypothetical protein
MVCVIMANVLNVIRLNVIMLSVVMLNSLMLMLNDSMKNIS